MNKHRMAFLIALCLAPSSLAAQGFDCGKAQTPIEKLICAAPEIGVLDKELNAAVQARMQSGKAPDPAVIHPVVIRHPETGRKILYVSPSYTTHFEGWTEAESRPLLQFLFRHAENPEWTCRFRWEKGSVAFWDNYQTWHFAVNDYDAGERVMHRIVVNGPPFQR